VAYAASPDLARWGDEPFFVGIAASTVAAAVPARALQEYATVLIGLAHESMTDDAADLLVRVARREADCAGLPEPVRALWERLSAEAETGSLPGGLPEGLEGRCLATWRARSWTRWTCRAWPARPRAGAMSCSSSFHPPWPAPRVAL
jgi:hypothetical protein